jgi:hypothetical protein
LARKVEPYYQKPSNANTKNTKRTAGMMNKASVT